MTREELTFKKRELQKQIDAIDRVLEMFPETGQSNRSNGRYADMTVPEAMVDYLTRVGSPAKVSDIAKALKAEGLKSTSPNFTTMISAVGNRLVDKKKLIRRTKNGRKAFAVPTNEGEEK